MPITSATAMAMTGTTAAGIITEATAGATAENTRGNTGTVVMATGTSTDVTMTILTRCTAMTVITGTGVSMTGITGAATAHRQGRVSAILFTSTDTSMRRDAQEGNPWA